MRSFYVWNEIWDDCNNLVREIKAKEYGIEMVVGISRGGVIPAAMLARQLDLPMTSIRMEEGLEQFGDTVCLVVDDIYDSGDTMGLVWYSGGKKHVYCCLYDKNLHPEKGLPDHAVDIDTTNWVVFPCESEDDE